jgi:hypothetical protein
MEKLKILIVASGVMTNVLGVLKVHYDLKEAYEEEGHLVDVLDFSVVYPNGFTTFTKIFDKLYTYRFWQYLKIHAHKYDVIDANYECIPYSKESFNFKGVLLVRSHGIKPIYYIKKHLLPKGRTLHLKQGLEIYIVVYKKKVA